MPYSKASAPLEDMGVWGDSFLHSSLSASGSMVSAFIASVTPSFRNLSRSRRVFDVRLMTWTL